MSGLGEREGAEQSNENERQHTWFQHDSSRPESQSALIVEHP
jgi:hypothetical protein